MSLYARDLKAPIEWVGAIIGIGGLVGVFLRLPAGALSTLVGRKKVLVAGMASLAAAPLVLVAFPSSLVALFATSLIYGGAAVFMPAALAYVNDIFPEEDRTRWLGYYTMFGAIGRALGPMIAGMLLASFSYTAVYVFCAVTGAAAVGLTMLVPPVKGERTRVMADLGAATAHPKLMTAYVARLVQTLALGCLSAYFPIFGKEVAGLTATEIGVLLSTNHVMAIISRPVTASLSSRGRRVPFMVVGMAVMAGALALIPWTTRFWALLPLFAVTGASEAACQIATIAYVSDIAGKKLFGAAIGIVGAFFDLGLVMGKAAPGWILPLFAMEYAPAFGVLSAVIFAYSLATGRLLKEPRASEQER
jgi:MFS family permease